MKPISISEKMMFATVRLVAEDNSSGTGFFFEFKIDNKRIPVLITNKHVVNYKPKATMTFYLHLNNGNGESDENIQVKFTTDWYFHPTKDICFSFAASLFEHVKQVTVKDAFYSWIGEDIVPSDNILNDLSALEELTMVGYPIGLWDKNNNLPIFRRGYTAAHPAIDFNEPGIGLVDMACFPGSSGSPIFILNEMGYTDKKGNIKLGAARLWFIGVLYAGPHYDATGKVIINDIPTSQQIGDTYTRVMANLGYYIKASEIMSFKSMINDIINDIINGQ